MNLTKQLIPLILILLINLVNSFPFELQDSGDNEVEIDDPDDGFINLEHLKESIYGVPSNDTGIKVAEWHERMGVNPEELGEYAEGDILIPMPMGRNGLVSTSTRWPGGTIPYIISPFFNDEQKAIILEAMDDFHKYTCIRFIPQNGDQNDYIRITAGNNGCWSSVGRIGGYQDVNLQVPGCITKKGTVIHELMHAVGFLHEQSRYDRDDYVEIQWHNILPGRAGNFEKASSTTTDAFGVKYDYGSVMHYSASAFSANGQPTIVPKEGRGLLSYIEEMFQLGGPRVKPVLGQREGFSKNDIEKIRKMYRC